MQPVIVPVSAILPTRNRAAILSRFFDSLEAQETLPAEMVICDSSDGNDSQTVCQQRQASWDHRWNGAIRWNYQRAKRLGLAPQRNQAVAAASQPYVWFLDDDMLLEPNCVSSLFNAVSSDASIGGVTATLINEPYRAPGRFVKALMQWFEDGRVRDSYASACVGPGWTFLHDDAVEGPALTQAEWLGGGCTIYRKEALPVPAVPDHFEAGAIGEDLAASICVGKKWKMYHVRAARAIHDSQGGDHKRSHRTLAEQGLRNRYYIMTRLMGKRSARDHVDFALMLGFGVASLMTRPSQWRYVPPILMGYASGIWKLMTEANDG